MEGIDAMAKEFKLWNRAFKEADVVIVRKAYMLDKDSIEAQQTQLESFWGLWFTTQQKERTWTHEEIRFAVYEAEDARRWQLFRVSMRSITTQEKLGMLYTYLLEARESYNETDAKIQWDIERCRVYNYLGALVRGGQIDQQCRIRKVR